MTMYLTGPLRAFQDCCVWLAMFDPEREDSLAKQLEELPAAQMSSNDLIRWQRFRPLEKKRQFLNSRLAVHSVLQKELGHSVENVRFEADEKGQPVLRSASTVELPKVSLSHSGTVVAVAVSHNKVPVGVDIEIVQPLRTEALRLITAGAHEMAWQHDWGGMNETESLRTLWTVKESVWKLIGGVPEISISDIQVDDDVHGVLISRVIHPSLAGDQFRTRLFAVHCEESVPHTMLVDLSGGGIMALRGAVSQWIPAARRSIGSDLVRQSQDFG